MNSQRSSFVYVSSLSVYGPVREQRPYSEIKESDMPRPNTAYGQSKLDSERFLDTLEDFPCVTLRPTGVYGPRECDYFMMAKTQYHKQALGICCIHVPSMSSFFVVNSAYLN